jgi:RNA polymerase sigma-70 factor (ECF subfamily)
MAWVEVVGGDEPQLIARAQAGDTGAFEQLAQRYAAAIYRVAVNMLRQHEEAEDARQETFLRAYRHLKTFRGEVRFVTWLYAITTNCCLKRATRIRVFVELDEDMLAIDAQANPAEVVQTRIEQYRVRRVLASLAPPDRLLIILKHLEGMSHDEIAHILHCSVESSRSRLTRACKLFRERYHREIADGTL